MIYKIFLTALFLFPNFSQARTIFDDIKELDHHFAQVLANNISSATKAEAVRASAKILGKTPPEFLQQRYLQHLRKINWSWSKRPVNHTQLLAILDVLNDAELEWDFISYKPIILVLHDATYSNYTDVADRAQSILFSYLTESEAKRLLQKCSVIFK